MNPFVFGKIVEGKNFFDRKEESFRIVKTLTGGNNIVLYAPRRFGKTSLAFNVIDKLQRKGHVCIYFDFMPVFSLESFVRLYAKAIAAKQSNLSKFANKFAEIIKGIRPVLNFNNEGKPEFGVDFANKKIDETVASELLDLPEKLWLKNKKVFVFFDEFQEVKKLDAINFENLLRSKIQRQTSVNYMFFGSKTHLLDDMFNNKKRAFYNSSLQMSISYLPEKETVSYLRKNLGFKKLSEDNAKYIIDIAGKIPYYIQFLAAEIWQSSSYNSKEITKGDIDECLKQAVELKSDYYEELFDRQSKSKKQFLQSVLKNGKNIFSSLYINEFNLGSPATVQRASKELVNDGILEKKDGYYFIADPFFRVFIEERL
jgi:hypothetical protein